MTDNLYAPPEADLIKPSDKGKPYVSGFDRPMVIAIILSVLVSLLTTGVFYVHDPVSFVLWNEVVGSLISFVLIIFVVYFIKRLRVFGLGTGQEDAGKGLGVWGYFWRTFVIQTVAAVLLMTIAIAVMMLSGIDPSLFFDSMMGVIVISLLLFPLSLFCTWAFFSKDRSGQLGGFFRVFRGY